MDESSKAQFAREVDFLRSLKHANLVHFYGTGVYEDATPFILLEFVERGSLRSVLDGEDELDWPLRVRFALDIARGMRHLHSRTPPLLHRDLKSENCLVDAKWTVKVGRDCASGVWLSVFHSGVRLWVKSACDSGGCDTADSSA